MTVNRIAIVSVPVRDQRRAKAFYAGTLGFTVAMDAPDGVGPGQDWIMLTPPSGGAALTLVTWFETMPAGSLRGLVIETDDIDAEHERLRTLGVAISGIETAPWGRYASLDDSEGNGIVLQASAFAAGRT